jgi:hypothetical protein
MSTAEKRKDIRHMIRKIEETLGYETNPVTIYSFVKELSKSQKVSKGFFKFVKTSTFDLIINPRVLYSKPPSFFALSFFYFTPKYRETALKFMNDMHYNVSDFDFVKKLN